MSIASVSELSLIQTRQDANGAKEFRKCLVMNDFEMNKKDAKKIVVVLMEKLDGYE